MSATVETLSISNQASYQETLTLRPVAPPPPPSADSVYIRPISAKEIRILAVHPGAPTDLLRCNFHIADLHDQRPDYETLSYTWNNEQPVMPITLGAQEYKVTRTVHSALLALRHPTELRWLWVDALCINQQDLIEKQVQVRQMGSIYSLCTHCNIWFGLIPEEFDEQTVRMAFDAIIWLSVPRPANTAPFYVLSKHIFEQLARVINAFMAHEWWYRIWTVQEALLPTEKSFHWGPLSLDYKALDMLSELLLGNDYIAHAQWHTVARFSPFGGFGNVLPYMLGLKFTRDEDPLSVLWRWRFRRASNPLDKIYALVGINDGLLRIVPNCDYSLSLRDLYVQVTVKLINERGLMPLIGWCSEKRAPGLPSWVVDWYGCQEAPRDDRRRWNVWRHRDLWNISCASIFLKDLVPLSYSEQDLTLSMTGCFVDTVSVIVTGYDGEDREQRRCRWQKRLQEYLKLEPYTMSKPGTDKPYRHHKNRTPMFKWKTQKYIQEYAAYTTNNTMYHAKYDEYSTDGEWYGDMVHGQTFYITTNGLVGLGPPDIRPGHQIWILSSSMLPMVLEEVPEDNSQPPSKFRFVGDTFTQGIMYGAASLWRPTRVVQIV